MRHLIFILVFTWIIIPLTAQEISTATKPKQFYFSWGYTRAAYSKSSIHFKNLSNDYNPNTGRYDYYDFTIHNAVAHDRPDFDAIKDVVNLTIPQYVFRIGYTINSKWGIELNYDHTKYIVDDHQRAFIEGVFNDKYVSQDTILDPENFLHFEHSDGANFWMINFVRTFNVWKHGKYFSVQWVAKPGAGLVIPRTDVTLFGERLNNDWKIAGWIVGLESGLRVSFLRNGFFEFVGKGSFADYMNTFVLGKHHGKAQHQFFTGQLTATIGMRFAAKK